MDITSFLYGMYYSGKLPSRAEYREITSYLRSSGLVSGKQVEKQVTEAIAALHRILDSEDEKSEGKEHIKWQIILSGR